MPGSSSNTELAPHKPPQVIIHPYQTVVLSHWKTVVTHATWKQPWPIPVSRRNEYSETEHCNKTATRAKLCRTTKLHLSLADQWATPPSCPGKAVLWKACRNILQFASVKCSLVKAHSLFLPSFHFLHLYRILKIEVALNLSSYPEYGP